MAADGVSGRPIVECENVRESSLASDLMAICLYAPLVVSARAQMLLSEMFVPTRKGQREIVRMTTEKHIAAAEVAMALQTSLWHSGLKLWSELARGSTKSLSSAPALAMAAAAVPVRRRVRRNAQRLSER
jgi:hypothetical protein